MADCWAPLALRPVQFAWTFTHLFWLWAQEQRDPVPHPGLAATLESWRQPITASLCGWGKLFASRTRVLVCRVGTVVEPVSRRCWEEPVRRHLGGSGPGSAAGRAVSATVVLVLTSDGPVEKLLGQSPRGRGDRRGSPSPGGGRRGAQTAQGLWRVSSQEGSPRTRSGRRVRPACSQLQGRGVSSRRGHPERASDAPGGRLAWRIERKPPARAMGTALAQLCLRRRQCGGWQAVSGSRRGKCS